MPKVDVTVSLVGRDGNVFYIIGVCSKEMERAGYKAEAKEYRERCFSAHSYQEVLRITMEYVNVT